MKTKYFMDRRTARKLERWLRLALLVLRLIQVLIAIATLVF